MYMSVCCTPGRIPRKPLPTLLCYFKLCCFNHTFDKKGIRRSSYWLTLRAVGDVVFVWRCVVDDINRCTCRCVVHPVGSEDPPYRHFELLIKFSLKTATSFFLPHRFLANSTCLFSAPNFLKPLQQITMEHSE